MEKRFRDRDALYGKDMIITPRVTDRPGLAWVGWGPHPIGDEMTEGEDDEEVRSWSQNELHQIYLAERKLPTASQSDEQV